MHTQFRTAVADKLERTETLKGKQRCYSKKGGKKSASQLKSKHNNKGNI